LELLGWDLRDARGRLSDAVPHGHPSHIRIALRVRQGRGESMGAYCIFLHIDHTPTRFAAEHRAYVYPMSLWQGGDVIIDDFEVVLPAHFRSGHYALFWGVGLLPCEDDRRMRVTAGPNDGHERIALGALEVR
ncbi:MAG TPA: hypothetical protein VNO21_15470, partial [Polyangiaceae bacterium]|nr:hypothetical protein [Polyangiaceae bacterium]